MGNKQTAVDLLEDKILTSFDYICEKNDIPMLNALFERAKINEKQQIRDLMIMAVISVADAFETGHKFEMEHIDQIIENYFI